MVNGHCVRTIHAEANAIVQSARNGVGIDESEIYVTASPCYDCFKLIANSGIKKVFFGEFYRDERINKFAKSAKIKLIDLSKQSSYNRKNRSILINKEFDFDCSQPSALV